MNVGGPSLGDRNGAGIPDYECLSKINGVPSVRHGLDVRLWFPWVTDGRLKRGRLIPVLAA
jgi:hypothetical protein